MGRVVNACGQMGVTMIAFSSGWTNEIGMYVRLRHKKIHYGAVRTQRSACTKRIRCASRRRTHHDSVSQK
jgi:hypothetical protein